MSVQCKDIRRLKGEETIWERFSSFFWSELGVPELQLCNAIGNGFGAFFRLRKV